MAQLKKGPKSSYEVDGAAFKTNICGQHWMAVSGCLIFQVERLKLSETRQPMHKYFPRGNWFPRLSHRPPRG